MCLCALFFQQIPSRPLVMAANREEHYDRPAEPPSWVDSAFAGRDLRAGGTWQGLNAAGLVVALTNRRAAFADPSRRSRGLLCLDALRHPSARAARDFLTGHLASSPCNPCNLILADARDAFALHHDGRSTRWQALPPGLHLLAETDVDDAGHPRLERARALMAPRAALEWSALRPHLENIMADHAPDAGSQEAICRHGKAAGTVSSSLLVLAGAGLQSAEFHYAPGPPCTHAYQDLTPRLRERALHG